MGWIEQKRRYRQYKARTQRLPDDYRIAVEGLERYMLHCGLGTGDGSVAMFEDLIDLFEQSAASRTPIRAVVGNDPVEFVEEFLKNYPEGQWISRERARLGAAIARAAGEAPRDDLESR